MLGVVCICLEKVCWGDMCVTRGVLGVLCVRKVC